MKHVLVVSSFLLSNYVCSNELEQINVYGDTDRRLNNVSQINITPSDIFTERTVTNFEDLTFHAPIFGTKKAGRAVAITVNGIGFNGGFHNPSLESTVALYVDGSYIPRQSIISTGIPDIISAEFTEGIQFVSPVTSGIGTIDITTVKPQFKENSFKFELGTGSNAFRSFGSGANISLGDKSALSFYISDMEDDGNLTNFHTGKSINTANNTLGYVRALHKFDDGLSIYLNHYQSQDKNGWTISGQTHHHNFNLAD